MQEFWQKGLGFSSILGLIVGLNEWDMTSGFLAGMAGLAVVIAVSVLFDAIQKQQADEACRKNRLTELDIKLWANVPISLDKGQKLKIDDQLRKRK